MTTSPIIKTCQRCQSTFDCRVGDVGNCGCAQVTVSPDTHVYLSKTHYDCLCSNCLSTVNKIVAKTKEIPFPKRGQSLIEDVHFYKENGLFIFTEFYHISRGYCCKNGCRHCGYGYKTHKS
ncbi:MAG: cysteine-rich CWC family protein [Bacteroidota bacterium]